MDLDIQSAETQMSQYFNQATRQKITGGERRSMMPSTGSPAHNPSTTMVPNLARSTHELIQDMISSKLQDDTTLRDDDIAKIAGCSTRTVRRIRSNLLLFGSTKAPSNGPGRPKTITPPMLTALYDQLALDSYMPLDDMAAFLRKEFEVDVTLFSIRRALKDPAWSKKINVARERNQDLRDEYVHEISFVAINWCL